MPVTFMQRCFILFVVIILIFIIFSINYPPNYKTRKVHLIQKHGVANYNKISFNQVYNFTTTTMRTKQLERRYFVHSAMCRMPLVRAHTPELYAMYEANTQQMCNNKTSLIKINYVAARLHYVIHINATVAGKAKVRCNYREILEPKTKSHMLRPRRRKVYFEHNYIVPANVSAMLIECVDVHVNYMQPGHRLTRDLHAFIQQTEEKRNVVMPKQEEIKPSVILLGIDSMSRINVQRMLPELSAYLKQSGWYEMQGYNKISDDTLANLYTVLTGSAPRSSSKQSNHTHKPYIWRTYRRAGYKTAFGMDTDEDYTLSTLETTLLRQTVDYRLRSSLIASRKRLLQEHKACLKQQNIDFIMTHCLNFVQRHLQKQPIFGFYWLNDFATNRFSGVLQEQNTLLHHLRQLKAVGLFEHAIVILFSDHGIRQGRMRELSDAFLEERMPLLHIWLPASLRKQFPHVVQALTQNRQRLTSNYDLYLTLRDILTLFNDKKSAAKRLKDCPKCLSLLRDVPLNRSCRDAGIKEHWCTCHVYKKVHTNAIRAFMPNIVAQINDYLADQKLEGKCMKLNLHYINEVQLKVWPQHRQKVKTYRIKFMLQPAMATFEITIQVNKQRDHFLMDMSSISRLDTHFEQSHCINKSEASKFCFCELQPKHS